MDERISRPWGLAGKEISLLIAGQSGAGGGGYAAAVEQMEYTRRASRRAGRSEEQVGGLGQPTATSVSGRCKRSHYSKGIHVIAHW